MEVGILLVNVFCTFKVHADGVKKKKVVIPLSVQMSYLTKSESDRT